MKDKEQELYEKFIMASIQQANAADLIAELEKRRPCEKCENGPVSKWGAACQCLWADVFYGYADNFKEAK